MANKPRPPESAAAGQPLAAAAPQGQGAGHGAASEATQRTAADRTPTGVTKGVIGNSQPRKQHMSENAVQFFKYGGYSEMFEDELEAIYTGVETSNAGKTPLYCGNVKQGP